MTAPVRAAFIVEQTLGHRTHYRNLRETVTAQSEMVATWLPIEFEATGPERLVPMLRSNWSVRASWRARRALGALMARESVDALFFHTQVTALFSRSFMRRVPTVISLDATPLNYDSVGQFYNHRPAGTGFIDRRKHEMNRQAFDAAKALVTWSDWAKQSLVDDYGVDGRLVHVITPGAGAGYFELGARRLARPPRDNKPTRLLFVGGDFERKGGALVLEAMRGSLGQTCELDIVTQERLPSPGPNVRFHTGVVANSPQLLDLFARADIFVMPTYADCLALVLMEAAAAALPVVTTTVGALGEAFVVGESGLEVPRGELGGLVAALTTLVQDPERRQRLGKFGHELACRKFDARRNNHALLNLVVDVARDWRATRRAA